MNRKTFFFYLLSMSMVMVWASHVTGAPRINRILCNSVDTIVRGSIVSIQKIPLERAPTAGIIARTGKKNVLLVEKVYKGSIRGKHIEVLTQGGMLQDDIELTIEDEPVFVNHEKVVLFLNQRKQPPYMYQVFGKSNGVMVIHTEQELLDIEQVLYKYL